MTTRIGAFSLPESIDGAGGLDELNPARDVLLRLFCAAIVADLDRAWRAATVGTTREGTCVVGTALPLAPTPQVMGQLKVEFPLVACYRTGQAQHDEHTLYEGRRTQRWGVDYVLGPLTASELRQVGDVLDGVAASILRALRLQGHPSHDGGRVQFGGRHSDGSGGAQLSTIRVVSDEQGPAEFASSGRDESLYHALSLTLETTELVTVEGAGFGEPGTTRLLVNDDAVDL
jgi:hypothetical protein